LTVSSSSKIAIIKRYSLAVDTIKVIPNSFRPHSQLKRVVDQNKRDKKIDLFYPGGVDFRKNVKRLILSLEYILNAGYDVSLRITGSYLGAWERELKSIDKRLKEKLEFLGYIDSLALHNEYINADVVVYPTLCEGFGRVCLEAMGVGAKLACSDIPVLHEVADDYAIYFNPFNIADIAKKILIAYNQPEKTKIIKQRYSEENVSKLFLETMKKHLVF
jgi:glycosyltransferase involved in cell wall biosynthesis